MTREAVYAIIHFPGLFGLINGTFVSILTHSSRPSVYNNRHCQHTINCNAQMPIYVNGTVPGSVHDAQVLEVSNWFTLLESWPADQQMGGDWEDPYRC